MKILIISERFAPQNKISSIRPTKIAKYLKREHGFEVHVMTVAWHPTINDCFHEDTNYVDNFYYIDKPFLKIQKLVSTISRMFSTDSKFKTGNIESTHSSDIKSNKLKNLLQFLISLVSNYLYFCRAKKLINKFPTIEFDIVFSTYGPLSSHRIAQYIKHKNKKVFWIADFRDTVYGILTPDLFKLYAKNYPKQICKTADLITAVSTGVMKDLNSNVVNQLVLTNGFDIDDIIELKMPKLNDKMSFAYTGTLYYGKRNFEVLFKAISELHTEGLLDINRIQFHYAGDSANILGNQIDKYQLKSIFVNHGYVNRKRSLEIQMSSHILLSATWNTKGSTGIVTGKLLEYMMIGKPILAVVMGELPNSIMKDIIKNCALGFCYEESNNKTDYRILKEYLLYQYNSFINHNKIMFEPNKDEISKYCYSNIVHNLLNNLKL